MRDRLRDLWDALHSSFWFVPSLMAMAAVALSFITIKVDEFTSASLVNSLGFIWSGGADGARSILSTVAGSMITVAGVVFSIVIVALTLASSQFGPRLLRNFVRDTGNQITLGIFIATFLYCILVLRTIRVKNEGNFIPYISITFGMVLAIASIGVLIYFIHHVSVAIHAENVISRVGHELAKAINEYFPERQIVEATDVAEEGTTIVSLTSEETGYQQSLDCTDLVKLAQKLCAVFTVKKLPGDFVFLGDVLMEIAKIGDQPLSSEDTKKAKRCFSLGDQRTESQDVRFGARQLAEIASRALSPGINDPYTAMGCIDWAAEALSRVAERFPAHHRYADESGTLRLKLEHPVTFDVMCAVILNPLVAYGLDSPLVACYLLFSLRRIAARLRRAEQALCLLSYVQRIGKVSEALLTDEHEKRLLLHKVLVLTEELRWCAHQADAVQTVAS